MSTNMQVVTQFLLKEAQNGFQNGNFVYSPASMESMLCMVAAGSKGQTLEQLLSFIGLKSIDELNLKPTSLKVMNNESSKSKGVQLCFANGIWVDKRFSLVAAYQEVLNKIYNVEAKSVDFLNQAEVVEQVNLWAANATKGLIKEALSPQLLKNDTMLILTNALYFKGVWSVRYKFDETLTKDRNFYLLNGQTSSTPFMTKSVFRYHYGNFNGCKVLKIPYEDYSDITRFSMYFFLPEEKDGIKSLIEKLNDDNVLFERHFDLKYNLLDAVHIPKFKFSCQINASDTMKELGLTRPFMAVKELTGIVDSPQSDIMYVDKILQKACIEVNEEGTEAAAVTVCLFGGGCGPRPPNPTFIADHPFMFVIREDISGDLLFVGAVLDPGKST